MKGIIYKITNNISEKVYIGLTTATLQNRWKGHKTQARKALRKERPTHPLYNAMAKYGIENFKIEQIDESDNFVQLGKLERKYIKEYNSADRDFGYNITRGGESNQLDANPRTQLTIEDVEEIRKIYNECKLGPQECWKLYSDRISFSAFEKVYEGTTWKSVMPEVYSLENKKVHKQMTASPGEKNGNAILTNDEVMKIRKYYVNHTLQECYEKYGDKFASKDSFRVVIDGSYKSLPIYSKAKKTWINGDTEKRVIRKPNVIRVIGNVLEIDTFDDYGKLNGTFKTDAKYEDVVKKYRWIKFGNGKICTHTKEKSVVFLHEFIMDGKDKKIYYVNGDVTDVRRANLTNNLTGNKIEKYGIDKFKKLLDEGTSLRGIGRAIGVSAQSIIKYVKDNKLVQDAK